MHSFQVPQRITIVLLAMLVVVAGLLVVLLTRHPPSSPATIQGSGVAAAQTRTLPTFRGVELAGAADVVVHVGGPQRVVVHADDNLVQLVTTRVRGGDLVIGTTGSFSTARQMVIDMTVPSLSSATLSGSGVVVVEGLRTERFVVDVSGSGVLSVTGKADRLTATLDGSGDVQLQDLVAHDATVLVAGSGRLLVQATGALDARVSGVGAIIYTGSPTSITQRITGTGSITSGSTP
jgi:Protein of unknown function (DUF2807).